MHDAPAVSPCGCSDMWLNEINVLPERKTVQ
jgi:hypothetical protein